MAEIVIELAVIALFSINDLIPVFKKKQWLLFTVYSVLMAITLLITILVVMKISVPSIASMIKSLISSILGLQ